MIKRFSKLCLAIVATTMIACSTANNSSTNSNSSESTTQAAEKIEEDKLAGKYSEETSEYTFSDEEFSNMLGNADIKYKTANVGTTVNNIKTVYRYDMSEYSNLENNIFVTNIYDSNEFISAAYNTPAMVVDPIVRSIIAVNNSCGDIEDSNGIYAKKHFEGFEIKEVSSTKINDREVAFFEGKIKLADQKQGYLCGYTFIADGNAGGYISGTWDKADEKLKDNCREIVDISIRSTEIIPREGKTEKERAKVAKEELSNLTETETLYRAELEYDMPSKNVLRWGMGSTYEDCENFSLYTSDCEISEIEKSSYTVFDILKDACRVHMIGFIDCTFTQNNQIPVNVTIGNQEIEAIQFDGTLKYERKSDSSTVSWKMYGYTFIYDNEGPNACMVVGFVKDINQSEETYQKVVKLTDDVFASIRPISDD